MMGLGFGPKDEANKLYSELSDTYHIALSKGVDYTHPGGMQDAKAKLKIASDSYRSSDPNVTLGTVKSIYEELMPQLKKWMAEKQKTYGDELPAEAKPGFKIVPQPSNDVDQEPVVMPPANGGAPLRNHVTVRPWYLAGGIDWRIIGGVAGSMVLLAMIMRRRG